MADFVSAVDTQIQIDTSIYALRNRIERCFNKPGNARRLATRSDKAASSYLGFMNIASIRLWIRHLFSSA